MALGYCALPVALRGISGRRERARQLVAGEVLAQELAQLLELDGLALAQLDDGGDGLAVLLVGDADDEAVVDGRVALIAISTSSG